MSYREMAMDAGASSEEEISELAYDIYLQEEQAYKEYLGRKEEEDRMAHITAKCSNCGKLPKIGRIEESGEIYIFCPSSGCQDESFTAPFSATDIGEAIEAWNDIQAGIRERREGGSLLHFGMEENG